MPMVRVTWFPQDKRKRVKAAKGITDAVAAATGMPREVVHVVFEKCPPDSWAVGGTLCSEMKKTKKK